MKNRLKDFDISLPPKLQSFQSVLGWCSKAVDSLSDRLMFREFEEDNFDLNEIFQMNNPDTFFDSAMRTVKRSEISAEFYSFPQKYVVGTSVDFDPLDKWKSAMSYMIEITKDEDGDVPKFGQFQQQSMAPHTEQLRMFAGLFAGETGLTLDDLGFPSDNPSSAEAIKSSHENLRLMARKAQRTFGTGFLNVGYLAACLRDDFPYQRRQFYLTKSTWEPIFEPDASALSSYGDGTIKINQAIPGYFDEKRMRNLTGF